MRIWFLASEYPPYFGGGIGTYTWHAARAMADAGHEVLVITLSDGDTDEKIIVGQKLEAGWKLEKVQQNWWVCRMRAVGGEKTTSGEKEDPIKYWQDLSRELALTTRELLELNRGARPDLIEVQDYNAIGYDLLKEKRTGRNEILARIPIGIYLHAPSFELAVANQANLAASFNQLTRLREKACLMMADGLMAPSLFLKNLILARMGMTEREISLMPCPYQNGSTKKEIAKVKTKRKNYLCVGRLEYLKGVWQLVQAMKERWENGSQEILTLIGEDTFFEPSGMTIRAMIEEMAGKWIQAGRLIIKDKMPREKLAAERRAADAIIVPSLYDNFPYTVTEALAEGRAVLANRSGGGMAEMIGEMSEGGWLFDWEIEGSFGLCLDNFEKLKVKEVEKRVRAGQRRILKMTNPQRFAKEKVRFGEKLQTAAKMDATQIKRNLQAISAFEQGLKMRRRLKKILNGWKIRQ